MKFTVRQVSDLVQHGVVAECHYSVDTPASIAEVLREMLRSQPRTGANNKRATLQSGVEGSTTYFTPGGDPVKAVPTPSDRARSSVSNSRRARWGDAERHETVPT